MLEPLSLRPLEIACGTALGTVAPGPVNPTDATSPVAALEAAVLPALERAPCLLSFSGGIDSSLVLAVAVRLARRRGLSEPVPVTWRFRSAPQADESRWQERVIAEVGVGDWVRLDVDGELDFVGPHAQALLRRHGLLYPANAHLHGALLGRARGGALLTGIGGDQILGLGRWREASRLLAGGRRPRPGDGPRVALALAPAAMRRRFAPRRRLLESRWLWPEPARRAEGIHAAERASEPAGWSGRVVWQRCRRDLALGLGSLEMLAADCGALVVNPLLEPTFVNAVARAGGWRGYPSRAAAVRALFGELVPATILERGDKALFGEAFWAEPSRTLARDWDGEAVDGALVDRAALRQIWRGEVPLLRTSLLLQQVWLARAGLAPSSRATT